MGLSCMHHLRGDWIAPVCSALFLRRGLYKGAASKGKSSWKTGGRQIERHEGKNPTDPDYSMNGRTNEYWFASALYLLRCNTSCSSHWSALYHGTFQSFCVLIVRFLTSLSSSAMVLHFVFSMAFSYHCLALLVGMAQQMLFRSCMHSRWPTCTCPEWSAAAIGGT